MALPACSIGCVTGNYILIRLLMQFGKHNNEGIRNDGLWEYVLELEGKSINVRKVGNQSEFRAF